MNKYVTDLKTRLWSTSETTDEATRLLNATAVIEVRDMYQVPLMLDFETRMRFTRDFHIPMLHDFIKTNSIAKAKYEVKLKDIIDEMETQSNSFTINDINALDSNSEYGLYIPTDYEWTNSLVFQYAIFSDKGVAKEGLSKIDQDTPTLFAVISRITPKGVGDLIAFLYSFIDEMSRRGLDELEIDLSNLNLNRLGRSLLSYAFLIQAIVYASEQGIALRLENISETPALFGIFAGSVSQTDMRFNQTVRRLRKYKLASQYGRSAKTDLVNNRVAYKPLLSLTEYSSLVYKRAGVDIYLQE